MSNKLCVEFGFDRSAIVERLNLLGLGGPAIPMIAAPRKMNATMPEVNGDRSRLPVSGLRRNPSEGTVPHNRKPTISTVTIPA